MADFAWGTRLADPYTRPPGFLAVSQGSSAATYYSTNAITWTRVGDLPAVASWFEIAYGNGRFVAAKSASTTAIGTSIDRGETWTSATIAPAATYAHIAYGGGIWAGHGGAGVASSSTDGTTWTARTTPGGDVINMVYGGGRFVTVTPFSQAMYSTNGTTWTNANPMPVSSYWDAVGYDGTRWLAVSGNAVTVVTSTDSVNWSTLSTLPTGTVGYQMVYGGGMWVVVGDSGTAASSTNGATWTARTMPVTGGDINILAYGGGLFLAMNSTTAATSPDGITWTVRTHPLPGSSVHVAYG